jgi:putative hemolysin
MKFFVRASSENDLMPSGIATGNQSTIVRELANLGFIPSEMARLDLDSDYHELQRFQLGLADPKDGFCKKCGSQMIIMEEEGCNTSYGFCPHCDMPEPEDQHYRNHCWNCQFPIDSVYCDKSAVPGMGYYCANCGKDLSEFKGQVQTTKEG